MEKENLYRQKMDAQLKEWSAQIDLLEAKIKNAGADVKLKQSQEIQVLREKQQAAEEKMHELGRASGAAWEQVKQTSDQVWADLKAGLHDAQSRFK